MKFEGTHAKPAAEPDHLVRVSDTADTLAVSPRTIWNLVRDGVLHPVRIGRATRFKASEIRQLVDHGRDDAHGVRLEPGPAQPAREEPGDAVDGTDVAGERGEVRP